MEEDRNAYWRAGIRWLSHYRGHSCRVRCAACSIRKEFRVDTMVQRLGDVSVESLRVVVARAMGCERVDVSGHMRCRMEIPLNAFELLDKPPSPHEQLNFPPDAHRLEDMDLQNVPEWYVISGYCKCGHYRYVDMKRMRAKFKPDARMHKLAEGLECKRCGNKKGNFFIFQRMLR